MACASDMILSFLVLAICLPCPALACSKSSTNGWHSGTYMTTYPPTAAPNGYQWTWRQCAQMCAEDEACEFWTLQLSGDRQCLMMANKGQFHSSSVNQEGDRDLTCLTDDPGPGAWVFSWSDEFNETVIDTSVWGYESGYVRNNEAQYYTDRTENSRTENGYLHIEAREDDWEGHQYTSASRRTMGKKSWLYGRFSIRAKIDTRQGSWPAWWWLPNKGGWPQGGEIDMMEYYQQSLLFNVMDGKQRWTSVKVPLSHFGGSKFMEDFHVWTWEWSSTRIQLFLDGVLYNDYSVSDADGTGPHGVNPFQQPGYILINQAIGGTAGGDPSHTQFPVNYYVDWLRVWVWDTKATAVTVNVTGGTGSGVFAVNTQVALSAQTLPRQDGYVFDHWEVSSGAGTLDNPNAVDTVIYPKTDIAVKAVFSPQSRIARH